MRLDEPGWWYGAGRPWMPRLLQPAGWIVGRLGERRWRRTTPYRSRLPVICIGNFTVGGTGKTPLALALARLLISGGHAPVFLSRGYGGGSSHPHRVDADRDRATLVGDEPLLLARAAPVFVARDRAAGARAIEAAIAEGRLAASVIVMDDGMQNPGLAKDLTLAVVDGRRGVGNGRVMPAGPLRAPLAFQAGLVDAVIVNGEATPARPLPRLLAGKPVFRAAVAPTSDTAGLRARAVVAFAGIGHPQRFFDLLAANGAILRETIRFGDHQLPSERDATRILDAAQRHGAAIVTTEKDRVRLTGLDGARGRLRDVALALPVAMQFAAADEARLRDLVLARIAACPAGQTG